MRLSEISKEEFHQKLVDPANLEIEKQTERLSKRLNHVGWNAAVGKVTDNSWEFTVYKTLKSNYDSNRVRGDVYNYFLACGFLDILGLELVFQDQDTDSITWSIEYK